MQVDDNMHNIARLKWACRRGMLELDVLLGNFLMEIYGTLSVENKQLFEELLTQNDQLLFNWLLGSAVPDDAKIKKIIRMIQQHAKNRISN